MITTFGLSVLVKTPNMEGKYICSAEKVRRPLTLLRGWRETIESGSNREVGGSPDRRYTR